MRDFRIVDRMLLVCFGLFLVVISSITLYAANASVDERLSVLAGDPAEQCRFSETPAVWQTIDPGKDTYNIVQIFPSTSHSQSETYICVDPNNASHMLVGVNAITNESSPTFYQGYYYTYDRGKTWGGSNVLPGVSSAGDPATQIDLNGNAFFSYITWFSGMQVWVKKSTDGGKNWLSSVNIPNAGSTDKSMMVVDVLPASPYKGYIYTAWTDFNLYPMPVKFARSTNGGTSYSNPVSISGSTANYLAQGVSLAVGTGNKLYATWSIYKNSTLLEVANGFNVSTDGGVSWGTAKEIPGLGVQGIRGYLKSTSIRVNSFPSIATDVSRNIIYVVWTDKRNGDPDIMITKSYDGGATWSAPKRVNDDQLGNKKDQWFPWVAVSEDGTVGVVFYDSRNDVSNELTTVYVAISYDEGATWNNVRVMDNQFLPKPIPGCATGYQGDYIGITAKDGSFFPCWCMPNPTTNIYQAYFADVPYGSQPDVSISLAPEATQVRRGETLYYTVTVKNNTAIMQNVEAESEVKLPNGSTVQVISPTPLSLKANQTKSKRIGNVIPGNAPMGSYTYTAYVKDPVTHGIISQDSFNFNVIP